MGRFFAAINYSKLFLASSSFWLWQRVLNFVLHSNFSTFPFLTLHQMPCITVFKNTPPQWLIMQCLQWSVYMHNFPHYHSNCALPCLLPYLPPLSLGLQSTQHRIRTDSIFRIHSSRAGDKGQFYDWPGRGLRLAAIEEYLHSQHLWLQIDTGLCMLNMVCILNLSKEW